jgi:hypothetical protein
VPVITSENRETWQKLATDLAGQRPSPGKRVRVLAGKRKGAAGSVRRHQLSRFGNGYRFCSDAQAQLRDLKGRYGWCVLIRGDDGHEFWADADNVEVIL